MALCLNVDGGVLQKNLKISHNFGTMTNLICFLRFGSKEIGPKHMYKEEKLAELLDESCNIFTH